jgi:hypothetical protein
MRSLRVIGILTALLAVMTMGTICDPQECGDGVCSGGETAYSCPSDCDYCGNGICTVYEDQWSCPRDCDSTNPICNNNGRCENGETAQNCPGDCDGGAVCGDGYCEGSETRNNCYEDCGWCGDGWCTGPENSYDCTVDCGCPWEYPLECYNECWNCAGGIYGNCCNGGLYVSFDAWYPYYCPIDGLFYSTIGDLNFWCAGWEYYCEYVGANC